MTTEPAGGSGTPAASSTSASPFAVTAPPELTLARDRTGTTTFTVTNLTGRPVRARLRPRAGGGAEDSWLSVVGDSELPMSIGSTITVDVLIVVPPTAAAGQHTVLLEAVAEDDTEAVAGQSVSFTVAAPVSKKNVPWLLLIIIGVLVLLLAGGAVWYFALRTEPAPVNLSPPRISGNARQGASLSADIGAWQAKQVGYTFQWERCTTAADCTSIPTATNNSYVLAADDLGTSVRVRVTATNEDDLAADAVSNPFGPVLPVQAEVPNLIGLSALIARDVAETAGFTLSVKRFSRRCFRPIISVQDPEAGTPADKGSTITAQLTCF